MQPRDIHALSDAHDEREQWEQQEHTATAPLWRLQLRVPDSPSDSASDSFSEI